ncbi:MAG: transcription elongation factor spt5, partial [Watsoniomyces obsoletus]
MQIVPSNEMPDCLRVNKSKELVNGSYVRIRRGLYSGDLAIVEDVVPNGLDVTVKLVPRLTYGLDEDDSPRAAAAAAGGDNKRKRPGFGTANNFANRPPPRPFNESEAKKKHARFLQQNRSLTGKSFTYRGDMYEDGFLIKDFKLQHLIVDNVQPKLEETQGFTKTGQDGTETLDLETLKHSLHDNSEGSYQ